MTMRGRTTVGNVGSLLSVFLAVSVVAGLLGAGLAIPAVAALGTTVHAGVQAFDALPSRLPRGPLAQQTRILAADGTVIATPEAQDRIVVPLSKVSPAMQHAQVAIEDARFFQHGAVDPRGLLRAVASNLITNTTQGASTLTQQYVKVALEDAALRAGNERAAQRAAARQGIEGYARKLAQLRYAVAMQQSMTKDQILDDYLNLVYYGDQAYGIEAAARRYFGIHASQLDVPQAAMLAGIVNAPAVTDPVHDPQAALQRRNVVLDKMHQQHFIDRAEWRRARGTPVQLHVTQPQSTCAASRFPYFCAYVMAWLERQQALGATTAQRINTIDAGGLTVHTTLEPRLQERATQDLRQKVPPGNPHGVAAATAVVQPGTGHVLAAVQSTRFTTRTGAPPGETGVNYAVDRADGGSGGFQFGSTAKMFAVVTALESGMTGHSDVYARPASASAAALFTPSDLPGPCGLGPGQTYPVFNDEGSAVGHMSLLQATAQSVNTAFVGLDGRIGLCHIRDTMKHFGLHQSDGQPIQHLVAPIALGANPVSPLTLANAYATVAAGGTRCDPVPVTSVTRLDGSRVRVATGRCRQVLDPAVASATTAILRHVLTGQGATAQGIHLAGGRPAAGKTGTANLGNATWFVGYTPQLASAVWVGAPDDINIRLRNIQLGGTFYRGQVFGATIAAPLWAQVMDQASQGLPVRPLPTSVRP